MKKTFFVSVVFAAMFLMIGCGDDGKEITPGDGPRKGDACEMQEGKDVFGCGQEDNLAVVLKCVEEKWAEHAKCEEGQTCNAEKGTCDAAGGDDKPATNCGNRITEEGEVCDGDAKECSEVDSSFTGGYATCKSDCTGYDTTACSSDGGNGGGNGGGTNKSECLKLAECFFACQDINCTDACIEAHQDARDTFGVLYNCVLNNESSCYPQFNCQECADEYNYCAGSGGGTSGTASCGEILQCLQGVTDQASAQACFDSGSQAAQSTFMDLQNCVQNNGCSAYTCEQCTTEYNTCANS